MRSEKLLMYTEAQLTWRMQAWRPLDKSHQLDSILSHIEQRGVANDYTVRYGSKTWQIARNDVRPGLRCARVLVEKRWDGAMALRFGARWLTVQACSVKPASVKPLRPVPQPRTISPGPKIWMRSFELEKAPPLWAILKDEAGDGITE